MNRFYPLLKHAIIQRIFAHEGPQKFWSNSWSLKAGPETQKRLEFYDPVSRAPCAAVRESSVEASTSATEAKTLAFLCDVF